MGCLKINKTVKLSWEESNEYCQASENATLVEILTETQMSWLTGLLMDLEMVEGPENYWTSGTDEGKEGRWYWVPSLQVSTFSRTIYMFNVQCL